MSDMAKMLEAAHAALMRGPVPAKNWISVNPPTNLVEQPSVYEVVTPKGSVLVDKWLVDLVPADQKQLFLATEAGFIRQ
jgi:hypothetical protein